MIKLALIVPYRDFIKNAFAIFREHNAHETLYNDAQYTLEEVIVTDETVSKVVIDADVVIIRGLFAKILRTAKKDIPIVEIPIPATDILHAVTQCIRRYKPGKIGVVGVHSLAMGVNEIAGLVDVDLNAYVMQHPGSGSGLVDQAVRDNCTVIIGGQGVCRYAASLGMDAMLVTSGRESFWQSLTNAKRAAYINRIAQEKTSLLQAMLESSRDGILAFDTDTHQVQMINNSAESILGVEVSLLDTRIEDAPFPDDFKTLLLNGSECGNEVFQYNNTMLNITKCFIKRKKHIVGIMINIQEVQGIQSLERTIRRKIYSKGHVAKATFSDVLAHSPRMKRLIATTKKYALTNSNILLLGESGTGKEIMAQSIHNHSRRRKAPFVAVNCAALPESLLESELFGYVPGAFTGAQKTGKPGFFELAHGGTIFLDEIGELPLTFQPRLLRVIQERKVMRLGGDSLIPLDVRIIAATNQDLEGQTKRGAFRQDLFFRLDVLRISIPSLRERREDIALLAEDFLASHFPDTSIEDNALSALCEMDWPGNVRQLRNYCERLAVLKKGASITRHDIEKIAVTSAGTASSSPEPHEDPLSERERLEEALVRCRYNRSLTAKELGMDRSTLWRKMKSFNL